MTSPRRRPDRPIRSVSLKITFKPGKDEIKKIRIAIPSAVMRSGICKVEIDGEHPAEVAEKARVLIEKLRSITSKVERL